MHYVSAASTISTVLYAFDQSEVRFQDLTSRLINLIHIGFQILQTLTTTLPRIAVRRGIRAKYKQPFVAQSEVTLTHPEPQPHNSYLNHHHHLRRVARLRSHDLKISLQNGSCTPESVTHARIPFHNDNAKQYANMRRIVCLRVCGSCSSWS